ncbi:MAG: DUF3127 domain-containing protein [Bacteroidia bacterium]
MNIQGKIHVIMDVQQVSNTFRKREFVLEYADNPMYPQYVLFQMVQDRVDLVSGYQVGDMVDVSFNIRGRQWTSPQGEIKYFNSLEAWRINPVQPGMMPGQQPAQQPGMMQQPGMAQPAQPAAPAQPQQPASPAVDVTQMADDDDLPF